MYLLTIDQLSERLGLSPHTVRHYVKAGKIPAPIIVGKSKRWLTQTIDNWLHEKSKSA